MMSLKCSDCFADTICKMGRKDKDKSKLKSISQNYTYSEAKTLLKSIGYVDYNKGVPSGSRVKFYRASDNSVVLLHKPHPSDCPKTNLPNLHAPTLRVKSTWIWVT